MFKNRTFYFFSCLVIILFFARVTFAQVKESSAGLNLAEQVASTTNSDASLDSPQLENPSSNFQESSPDVDLHTRAQKRDARSDEHVIANQSIQDNELSLNELRAIFSLRARQWPDGTPITVFVLRDEQEVHRQFLLKTLKMLPHQLRRQWDRVIYSGIGQGPIVVKSKGEMISKVKTTPGAIGYIEGGAPDDQVLILSIH